MRVKMDHFDKKILPHIFKLFLSRYEDTQIIDAYLEEAVPLIEEMCPEVGSDKWLMGTDELTQLDVHAGAMMDFTFSQIIHGEAFSDAKERAKLDQVSPKWFAYMERLRAHPKIAPVCMNLEAANRYSKRARGWEQGVKCQLSLEVLTGIWPDLP